MYLQQLWNGKYSNDSFKGKFVRCYCYVNLFLYFIRVRRVSIAICDFICMWLVIVIYYI